jgi:hypothetical protein
MNSSMRTYQTRIHADPLLEEILDKYSALFAEAEHLLFKAMILGIDPNTCKMTFLSALSITGRQYNACKTVLEGKISSIRIRRKG